MIFPYFLQLFVCSKQQFLTSVTYGINVCRIWMRISTTNVPSFENVLQITYSNRTKRETVFPIFFILISQKERDEASFTSYESNHFLNYLLMQNKMGFTKPQKTAESLMYFKYFTTFPLILCKESKPKSPLKTRLVLNTSFWNL